jgi:integrase
MEVEYEMARALKRGPRNAPKFYVQFDRGRTPDGKRLRCTRLLKGVENLPQARQEAARVEREIAAGRDPFPEGIPVAVPGGVAGPLLQQWAGMLKNRNARDDRSRITRHLLPEFEKLRVEEIGLPAVMNWVDRLAASELSPQSQRHLLGLMSRFFSWCIERGLATTNPVRMVPVGKRPVAKLDADRPWLDDETKVPELMAALGPEVGLMFYLGNRSGLRPGEVCGLRMGDLEFLHEGVIRVAHSYGGPLKEDKKGEGKVKWVPAPSDAEQVLGSHLNRRRADGARADSLVFPFVPAKPQNRRRTSEWTGYRKEYLEHCWEKATRSKERPVKGIELTWYEATRHSFVSRNLKAGVQLDEVSAAVGHATPATTKRHYAHFVRKIFNLALRQGVPARKEAVSC